MNTAHLHLLVNHLPILGAFLSLPVLAVALWRSREAAVFGVAAMLLVLASAGAGASMRTGEGAEEAVEDLPGVSERLIEDHEEKAELATGLSVATAVLALGVLGWAIKRGDGVPRGAVAAVLLANLATAGAMANVGAAGGVIRHTEIRDGAAQPGGALPGDAAGAEAAEGGEEEEEEEE